MSFDTMKSIIMEGAIAFHKGVTYDENPHRVNTPQSVAWAKGHNQAKVGSVINRVNNPIIEPFIKYEYQRTLKENTEESTEKTQRYSRREDFPDYYDGYEHIREQASNDYYAGKKIHENPHPKHTHEHKEWSRIHRITEKFDKGLLGIPWGALGPMELPPGKLMSDFHSPNQPLKENRIIDYFKKNGM